MFRVVVLLRPGFSERKVEDVGRRLALAEREQVKARRRAVTFRMEIGTAIFPQDGRPAEDLLSAAGMTGGLGRDCGAPLPPHYA